MTTLRGDVLAEFTVPMDAAGLWLSPGGRYVALSTEDRHEQLAIHAGAAGGALTTFEADDAAFLDEGRLLLLERRRTAAVLRLIDLEGGSREIWSRRVPLWAGKLSIDRSSRMWRLLGWNEDGEITGITGRVGDDGAREMRWTSPGSGMEQLEPLTVSGEYVVAFENKSTYGGYGYGTRMLSVWSLLMQPTLRTESRLWTIGPESKSAFATSHLDVSCRNASLDEASCAAYDGVRTTFFAIDGTTPRVSPIASVAGRFFVRGDAGSGWILGWLDRGPVIVRPSTREAIRLPEGGVNRGVDHVAMTDRVAAAVTPTTAGSIVRLYSFEGQRPAGAE